MEGSKEVIVSSSLLGKRPPPLDWKPPKEFLLGLGEPWEPYPWDYDSDDEIKPVAVPDTSGRWRAPTSSKELDKLRESGAESDTKTNSLDCIYMASVGHIPPRKFDRG